MTIRLLAKHAAYHTRRGRVRALALPRSVPFLRRQLHLPSNSPLDPLAARPSDGVQVTLLDPPDTFRRPVPRIAGDPANLRFFQQRQLETTGPSYVLELEGGRFWGSPFGAVLAKSDRFVTPLSRDPWGPHLHAIWSRARLPAPRTIRGRILYLVTPEAPDNFHHWMIDLLPRLDLVRRAGFTPADFSHVFLNYKARRYQTETLLRMGWRESQLHDVQPDDHVRADSLVVPSLKATNQSIPAADVTALRRALLPSSQVSSGRRIFLSRRDAGFRRLLNEDALRPILEHHGFEIVAPGSLDVAAQARLFAGSEWIAGAAGAGFANLVFAPAGARVLEIAPPQWLAVYHWMISARCGLDHTVLIADGPSSGGQPDIIGRRRDFTVAPHRLESCLTGEFAATSPARPLTAN